MAPLPPASEGGRLARITPATHHTHGSERVKPAGHEFDMLELEGLGWRPGPGVLQAPPEIPAGHLDTPRETLILKDKLLKDKPIFKYVRVQLSLAPGRKEKTSLSGTPPGLCIHSL